jgi:uncharacterized protein YuzE
MAVTTIKKQDIHKLVEIAGGLTKLPSKKMWVDYDQEADVLYLSFRKPQKATDSEMLDNGIIIRRKGRQIVGVTILEASTRK